MADTKAVLTQWIIEYLKSKDIITKKITAIKQKEQNADVIVESTLKTQFVFVQPQLTDFSKLNALKDQHTVIVTKNTKENIEFLLTHWDELVQHPHLSIYFVNPKSSLDKRWIIFPSTHERITERQSLRKGIESMFATVEEWKE